MSVWVQESALSWAHQERHSSVCLLCVNQSGIEQEPFVRTDIEQVCSKLRSVLKIDTTRFKFKKECHFKQLCKNINSTDKRKSKTNVQLFRPSLDYYSDWQLQISDTKTSFFKNSAVIIYTRQENKGAPSARNNGLTIASGKFLKFLDSDDVLIAGALEKEISFAEQCQAQIVVTGWKVQYLDDDLNEISSEYQVAPNLDNGIDDMLLGNAPWTSAAIYRRSELMGLSWDESVEKAQEWMWAWQLCLAGLKFRSLEIFSATYVQYCSEQRITHQGNTLFRSTIWRLKILKKVEAELRDRGLLTNSRAKLLARYYYKDARIACEIDSNLWFDLHDRIMSLDDQFQVVKDNKLISGLISLLGLKKGVYYFVRLKLFRNKLLKLINNNKG